MQKVVLIGDIYSPHYKKWARAIASLPREKGFDFRLLSDVKPSIDSSHVERSAVYRIFMQIGLLVKTIKCVLTTDCIFHVHYVSTYSIASLFIPSSRLVSFVWGSDIEVSPIRNKLLGVLIRKNLRRSRLIISSSNYLAKKVREIGVENIVNVVPFGVAKSYIISHDRLDQKILEMSRNRTLKIGCFKYCRINVYGFDRLLDFLRLLSKVFSSIEVHFIDAGPDTGELKRLCESFENDKIRFFFHDEVTDQSDMITLIDAVDFTIYLSRRESFGVAVLESMARGVPVIGAPIGGIEESLVHNQNGFFCGFDDEAYRTACEWIVALRNDPVLYRAASEFAVGSITSKYLWNRNFEAFLKIQRHSFG